MWGLYGNYGTNQRENVGHVKVDYWIKYYDVITSPRWRTTAANMKIVKSAYLGEKWSDYDYDNMWCAESGSDDEDKDVTKTFKMADRLHVGKRGFGAHNSTAN